MTEFESQLSITKKYIFPSTLEEYLEKDLLKEYLHALDEDSLEYAMDFIEMDNITETRELILYFIQKEFEIRENNRYTKLYPTHNSSYPIFPIHIGEFIKSEKSTLLVFLANHKLTEYLQTLTDSELEQAERNLYVDDIVGDALDILSSIRIEKEYRKQNVEENKSIKK